MNKTPARIANIGPAQTRQRLIGGWLMLAVSVVLVIVLIGRLLEAKRDVTFLVRPRRAAQLAEQGLVIKSQSGDVRIPHPPTVQANELREPFDLVLLSCKAYDLDDAVQSFVPAVGPHTTILPLLNGMRHLDTLSQRFGESAVLGGLCFISVAADAHGEITHLNDTHQLSFGERDGTGSPRITAVADALGGARFDARLSEKIVQEMWEKWVFIAAAAGITCLMRASIGDIVAAGGALLATALFDECAAIASDQGYAPSAAAQQRGHTMLTAPGSPLTASMLRDVEQGKRTEVEHILGDLVGRRVAPDSPSLLRTAYVHLRSYEIRRAAADNPSPQSRPISV